ncbi:MAG: hypothetical protein AW10_02197 [Candidatus Accumulibacter appositus]|uniref:Uncharacterized protein n=1 Tax=Candidatus Accumulibacter appositus TaxID=1454003 RepID=A0A011NB91_9PROT|nr:MAG: hypothetical protein AW10_02197 [Candidatus Accumulibacter appositus]
MIGRIGPQPASLLGTEPPVRDIFYHLELARYLADVSPGFGIACNT